MSPGSSEYLWNIPFICCEYIATSFSWHDPHHLMQPLITWIWGLICKLANIDTSRDSHPTPPTINTSLLPICAIALSVISTSIAKIVSWSEKHKSWGVIMSSLSPSCGPFGLNRLSKVYASTDVSIPERLTSIPFVVYGNGTKRLPLNTRIKRGTSSLVCDNLTSLLPARYCSQDLGRC